MWRNGDGNEIEKFLKLAVQALNDHEKKLDVLTEGIGTAKSELYVSTQKLNATLEKIDQQLREIHDQINLIKKHSENSF